MDRILFDLTIYQYATKFHGGGEYGYAVLKKLFQHLKGGELGVFFFIGHRIDRDIIDECLQNGVMLHPCTCIKSIPALIRKYDYKTVFSALPIVSDWSSIQLPPDVRFIYTIHGLRDIELVTGEYEYGGKNNIGEDQAAKEKTIALKKQRYEQIFAATANRVILTDSEHSRANILRFFPGIKEEELNVLYPPEKIIRKQKKVLNEEEILGRYAVASGNYGLIISAGLWYKNGRMAVLAYDKVFDLHRTFIPDDFKVIILGVDNEAGFRENITYQERFVIRDYVEEEELEVLYQHAHLFVYPSLNEGFGYPPLEAMKYGTLCACSVNTSIPEVCRDMVLYFNPLVLDETVNRLLQSFMESVRTKMQLRMKEVFPLVKERQQRDLEKLIQIMIGKDR